MMVDVALPSRCLVALMINDQDFLTLVLLLLFGVLNLSLYLTSLDFSKDHAFQVPLLYPIPSVGPERNHSSVGVE